MSTAKPTSTDNPWMAFMSPFMNAAQVNPFASLPGMTASPPTDVNTWMKALEPAEIERRIQELKVVEMWLQTQVNMVQVSIQTMTLQKQSMEALKQTVQAAGEVGLRPAKPRRTRK